MELISLNMAEMAEFCEVSKLPERVLSDEINYYLKKRIGTSRFFTKEEMDKVCHLSRFVKRKFSNDGKVQNTILKELQNLLFISQDRLYGTDNYSKIKKLNYKKKKGLTDTEYYDYMKLLLEHASSCLSVSMIESLLKEYFSKSNSKGDLVMLLSSYDYSDFTRKEKIQMNDMIDYMRYDMKEIPIYKIVQQFMEELDKKKVSYKTLDKYLMKMQHSLSSDISADNFALLKDALEYFVENQYLRLKIDDVKNFLNLQNKAYSIYDELMNLVKSDYDVKKKLMSGKIVLVKDFPSTVISSIKTSFDNLEKDLAPRIITIDFPSSNTLEQAFSIQKFDDIYVLKAYITDVPTFLKGNRELCKEVYRRGNRIKSANKIIPMFPKSLSDKYFSFNVESCNNAIVFTFVVGKNGQIYSKDISRKKIQITHKFSTSEVEQVLNSREEAVGIQNDLRNYGKVYRSIFYKTNDEHLKKLGGSVHGLVALPSILVNYYIGHEAEFAIYRQDAKYTRNFINDPYTHSATPLRKFVSNINLAFFLHQNGVVNFKEKDLNYVEQNIEEILHHLNEQDTLRKIAETEPDFVKRYIR